MKRADSNAAKSNKKFKVTLVRSLIGRLEKHKATARTLGLRRLHQTVVCDDNACTRGMVRKIRYLIKLEEYSE